MDIRRPWQPLCFGLSLTVRRNPVGTLLATAAGKQTSVVGSFNRQRGCCRRLRRDGVTVRLPILDLFRTTSSLRLPFGCLSLVIHLRRMR